MPYRPGLTEMRTDETSVEVAAFAEETGSQGIDRSSDRDHPPTASSFSDVFANASTSCAASPIAVVIARPKTGVIGVMFSPCLQQCTGTVGHRGLAGWGRFKTDRARCDVAEV